MYGNGLDNEAWYDIPEHDNMTEEEFENAMSNALSDFETVRKAIGNVFDSELFKRFHVEHTVSFHELLRNKVLQSIKADILKDETIV